jgi:myo-inositol 2-dehydrogenase / D-chiro-inositol 1-dehydrogenase
MRIGVLGTGRIGLMHARNLAQTTGVDEVVLMGRNQARLAVSVELVCAAIQPEPRPRRPGTLPRVDELPR